MDVQQFDTITRIAAEAPDRRNVLKMVGAAAVASVAGAVGSRAAVAGNRGRNGALVHIEDVLNGNEVDIEVKNTNVAVQVCAVIQDINALFVLDDGITLAKLTCEVEQEAGDED